MKRNNPYIGGIDEFTGKQFYDIDMNGRWLDDMADDRNSNCLGFDVVRNDLRYRNCVDLYVWVYSLGTSIFFNSKVYKQYVKQRLEHLAYMIGPEEMDRAAEEAMAEVEKIYPGFEQQRREIQDVKDQLREHMNNVKVKNDSQD